MAFKKPTVKKIEADISNLSIYLRSVKKFGKSTLFRDMILAKYGDAEKGLLVEIGHEFGDTLLDNVNSTHVDTYKDFMELKKWLIEEKGKEHDIKIIGFDVCDEMIPIFENEVIRLNNIENPTKKAKTIKSCFGGFNAGVEMAAKMIKEYITELKKAGFGIVAIAHTKMKQVKEKGSLDEEGYQVLTSNLQNAYESVFGDISDLVLTGYIDRNIETVGEGDSVKRYATSEIRKLYFRGTSLIDAGSRFSVDAVPEYMVFDKMNMGEDFINTIEDGIKKSRTVTTPTKKMVASRPEPTPVEEEVPFDEDVAEEDIDDIVENTTSEPCITADDIRALFKDASKEVKTKVKEVIAEYGKLDDADQDGLNRMYEILK